MIEIQTLVTKEQESSAVSKAITALALRLARLELSAHARAQLKLCYLLPAVDGQIAFQGMRLSTLDAVAGVLTIEACVPPHIVTDQVRAGLYVLAVAADAIDAAREFFSEQGAATFDAESLQTWLSTVTPKDLLPPPQQRVRNTDFS